MTTLTNLENAISVAETDVINFFSKVFSEARQIENVVAQDFLNVLQWVEAHGTQISQIGMTVVSALAGAGIGVPASVITASTLLTEGVTAVNTAIAAAQAAQAVGKGTPTQAVAAASAAYQAFNNAKNALVAAPKPAAS